MSEANASKEQQDIFLKMIFRRGSQVVRQQSAKLLYIGSIPIRAFFALSKNFLEKRRRKTCEVPNESFEAEQDQGYRAHASLNS